MAVDRTIWMTKYWYWPQFPCPNCKASGLRIDEKSIVLEETSSSEAAHRNPAWQPEWVVERFSAIMTCSKRSCGDKIFVCGTTSMETSMYTTPDGGLQYDVDRWFTPRHFEPAPPVFPIHHTYPKAVAVELQKAFALMWSDIGSAGNRLRVATEALLNELKVPRKEKTKKGKFAALNLHERIRKFQNKNDKAAAQLMAVKWLGNTASHTGIDALTHDDLLNAFEHFEHALDLIYLNRAEKLDQRAKAISKSKGPVRAKRKS